MRMTGLWLALRVVDDMGSLLQDAAVVGGGELLI